MSEYTEIPTAVPEEEACELFEQQNPGAADSCVAFDGDIYLLDTGESGVQTLLSFGWFAFFVVIQGLTGGSPGKLLFGLRVVDQYGAGVGIGRSLGSTKSDKRRVGKECGSTGRSRWWTVNKK